MTAIIVTYNSEVDIVACLESLAANGVQALVIDTGSSDRTLARVRATAPEATVVEIPKELGCYGYAINVGMARLEDEIALAANADTVFPPGSIQALCDYVAQNPDVGLAGPQLLYPDGHWQCSANYLPGIGYGLKKIVGWTAWRQWRQAWRWRRGADRAPREVEYVVGAIMALRRQPFEALGGFDTHFVFYGEESDYCLRLRRAGWRVTTVPGIAMTHVGGASSTRQDASGKYTKKLVESRMKLARKHLSVPEIAIYALLEQGHAVLRHWTCRLLERGAPRHRRASLRDLGGFYQLAAREWREQRRAWKLARAAQSRLAAPHSS